MQHKTDPVKKVAIAILVLPDGRLVFQRRTADAPVNAGLLGNFGGHVETGETYDEAIRRELREETSLPINKLDFKRLDHFIAMREGKAVEYHPYEIAIDTLDFDVFEGDGAEAYIPQDMLKRDDLTSSVRHILETMNGSENVSTN